MSPLGERISPIEISCQLSCLYIRIKSVFSVNKISGKTACVFWNAPTTCIDKLLNAERSTTIRILTNLRELSILMLLFA